MGRKTIYYSTLLLVGLLLFNCSKDDDSKKPDNPDANELNITALSVTQGKEGDPVTLTGTGFSTTASANTVTFGGTEAEVSSSTPTSISTSVPVGAQTGKIQVTVDGSTVTSEATFTVLESQPDFVITDFEPKEGSPGDFVTITGMNFGISAQGVDIFFNGTQGGIDSYSDISISVQIPNGATTGPIKLVIGNEEVVTEEVFTIVAPTGNPWLELTHLENGSRTNGIAASLNDKIYIGLGQDEEFNLRKDLWEYNPLTKSWTKKEDFPGDGSIGTINFVLNDKLYVGAGAGAGEHHIDFWEYDPTTNSWSSLTDLTHGLTGRIFPYAFSINNRAYVYGGHDDGLNLLNDLWEYNPESDSWIQKASPEIMARASGVSLAANNKGYVIMGITEGGDSKEIYAYDPASNHWSSATFPGEFGRRLGVGFSIDGLIYMGMGYNETANSYYDDLWEYNPLTNTWTEKTSFIGSEGFNKTRAEAIAVSLDGNAYFGTGSDDVNQYYNDLWVYTPANDVD